MFLLLAARMCARFYSGFASRKFVATLLVGLGELWTGLVQIAYRCLRQSQPHSEVDCGPNGIVHQRMADQSATAHCPRWKVVTPLKKANLNIREYRVNTKYIYKYLEVRPTTFKRRYIVQSWTAAGWWSKTHSSTTLCINFSLKPEWLHNNQTIHGKRLIPFYSSWCNYTNID